MPDRRRRAKIWSKNVRKCIIRNPKLFQRIIGVQDENSYEYNDQDQLKHTVDEALEYFEKLIERRMFYIRSQMQNEFFVYKQVLKEDDPDTHWQIFHKPLFYY